MKADVFVNVKPLQSGVLECAISKEFHQMVFLVRKKGFYCCTNANISLNEGLSPNQMSWKL